MSIAVFISGAAGAVVAYPPSMKDEPRTQRQKLAGLVDQLQEHEEKSLEILKEIRRELQ